MAKNDNLYERMLGAQGEQATQAVMSYNDVGAPPAPTSFGSKIQDAMKGGVGTLLSPAAGFAQGAYNAGASALNLGRGEDNQLDALNTRDMIPDNPLAGVGHTIGDVGGGLAADLLAYKGLGKIGTAAKSLSGLKHVPGWLRNTLRSASGAGVGYAGNEFGLGGREFGGIAGAITAPFGGSTNKGIASTMEADANAIKKAISPKWDAFYAANEVPHISGVVVKDANKEVLEGATLEALQLYNAQPSTRTAAKLVSLLKSEQRGILGSKPFKSLDPEPKRLYNSIEAMRKEVERNMQNAFSAFGKKDAWKQYEKLAHEYATEYMPYRFLELDRFTTRGIDNRRKGSAEGVMSGIEGMKAAENDVRGLLLERYPELYLNKFAQSLSGVGKILGLPALGAKEIIDQNRKEH